MAAQPLRMTEQTDVSILAWFFPLQPCLPQGPRVSVSHNHTSPISASRPLYSPCWGRGREEEGAPRLLQGRVILIRFACLGQPAAPEHIRKSAFHVNKCNQTLSTEISARL